MSTVKDLYEFLLEAELPHYYQGFRSDLKVTTVPQIKYVEDEDLVDMGMSRPEIRRLKKFFRRECPQGAFGKIRKILSVKGGEAGILRSGGSESPQEKSPQHGTRVPSKHIIAMDSLTVCKTLGTGEFGTVQQGVWTNEDGERVQVAIKKLSKDRMQAGTPDFLKEATIMHSIDHEHIVRLYGVVLDSDALMLVTELAPLRSLLECLKEPAMRSSFSVTTLCDYATQVADGMSYLENKRLIHRDLASRNILVFTKDIVKVSDFGLSRALGVGKDYYQTNFSVNLKLPIAWCAPECINYLKFTTASDVWAYGVTLWEMFSYGFQPWAAFTGQQTDDSDQSNEKAKDHWQLGQKILEAIDEPNCQRLEQPECCPREHYAIMLKCWEQDAKRRPTFAEIHRMLPQIKPEQVQTSSDSCQSARADFLQYRYTDIITVLDKRPEGAPGASIWKGIRDTGKVGLFDSSDTTPYIEIKAVSPLRARIKMSRRDPTRHSLLSLPGREASTSIDSSRKSIKSARKLRADMISRPQNDLRHTGHIGYDGAMFGDIAFIGNNYDKLPVKVVTPYKPQDDVMASTSTAHQDEVDGDKGNVADSKSDLSIISGTSTITEVPTTYASQLSIASSQAYSDTFTDVSSYQGDADSLFRANGRASGGYDEINDDFDDFKMPDISSSFSLDLGTSFMDEVMKAFSDVTDKDKTPTDERRSLVLEDGSPHLNQYAQSSHSKSNGISSFDNLALNTDYGDLGNDLDSSLQEQKENEENSAMDTSRSSELVGSRSSSSATLGSQASDEVPSPAVEKKRKPKLRIDDDDESIPVWDSKKHDRVRPLSAKEEKTIEDAIAVANEFAAVRTVENASSPSPSDPLTPRGKQKTFKDYDYSPKDSERSSSERETEKSETLSSLKSVFSLRKKSPKGEGRVFSEEVSGGTSGEDLSAEAQEAYNLLVVRGASKEKERVEDGDAGVEHRRHARDRRMRRSLEHQRHSGEHSAIDIGAAKERNQNLRAPQGIPGRGSSLKTSFPCDVDVNPLRRLRDSTFVPRAPRPPSGEGGEGAKLTNGHNITPPRSTSLDHLRRPNIAPPSQFLTRLRDSESEKEQPTMYKNSHSSDEIAASGRNGDHRQPPVPPRKPLRPGTINTKPRERKYPLDMNGSESGLGSSGGETRDSQDSVTEHHTDSDSNSKPSSIVYKDHPVGGATSHSHQVEPQVSAEAQRPSSLPEAPKTTGKHKSYAHLPPFAVKNVTSTAEEMGIANESDSFWSKPVDFKAFSDDVNAPPQEGGLIPIRYKSPDSVSYEDLMEFALDGSSEEVVEANGDGPDIWWSGEQNVCDEIRLMRKVLSKDVTVEDCLMALEETKWDVHAAIKYLKLKQLLSARLGDVDTCKGALIRFSWNVPEAADYMLANPPDQHSPDIVEL